MTCDLKQLTLHQLRYRCNEPDDNSCPKNVDDRDHIFAAALDVENLDDRERAVLAVAQRVYREERSCDTPIEKFVLGLLESMMYRAVDLDDVLQDLKDLRLDWRDALKTARSFYAQHRELVTGQPESQPTEESASDDDTDQPSASSPEDDPLAVAAAAVDIALVANKGALPFVPSLDSTLKDLQVAREKITKRRQAFGAEQQDSADSCNAAPLQ